MFDGPAQVRAAAHHVLEPGIVMIRLFHHVADYHHLHIMQGLAWYLFLGRATHYVVDPTVGDKCSQAVFEGRRPRCKISSHAQTPQRYPALVHIRSVGQMIDHRSYDRLPVRAEDQFLFPKRAPCPGPSKVRTL